MMMKMNLANLNEKYIATGEFGDYINYCKKEIIKIDLLKTEKLGHRN